MPFHCAIRENDGTFYVFGLSWRKALAKLLAEKDKIRMPTPDPTDGAIHLHVNESLLQRDNESILAAFKAAVPQAKA